MFRWQQVTACSNFCNDPHGREIALIKAQKSDLWGKIKQLFTELGDREMPAWAELA